MSVFRVERTKDYTVMSNYHLRDRTLSLKAKGLLSQMLSLPDDWDYTLAGLACINKETKGAIRTAVVELENAGYVVRHQKIESNGKFGTNEYVIYEYPLGAPAAPSSKKPATEKPLTEKPATVNPPTENDTQLNTNQSITQQPITDSEKTDSPSFPSGGSKRPKGKRSEPIPSERIKLYRTLILENIDYGILREQESRTDILDEIVELMVETVCSNRETIRVSGSDFPQEVVKGRLLKLNSDHIHFVMDCMRENTTQIRNIKQYLLTVLFNAPYTISSYYYDEPGIGRHGAKLHPKSDGSGLSGISHHYLCGNLRRSDPEYRHTDRHHCSNLDLYGLHGPALLYAL